MASGSIASYKRPRSFASIMHFLNPFISSRPTSSNMSQQGEGQQERGHQAGSQSLNEREMDRDSGDVHEMESEDRQES